MPYMAVGSRQILFSDSPAPASPGVTPREVSNLRDNESVRAYDPGVSAPEENPTDTPPITGSRESEKNEGTGNRSSPENSAGEYRGQNLDVRA